MEQEVSDRLEKAVQQLGQLERVRSKSERGLSTLTVTVKDNYDRESLPQVWDELRRKIDDVQRDLPPGAGPSIVLDDYGDVYSVFLVVTGDGYSYAELKDYVDGLRRGCCWCRTSARSPPSASAARPSSSSSTVTVCRSWVLRPPP